MSKDKDYEKGYGKPPKRHQWKPGQSGNPKGRPKKKDQGLALKDIVFEELAENYSIVVNGKRQQLSAAKIIIKKQITKALEGDIKAVKWLDAKAGGWTDSFLSKSRPETSSEIDPEKNKEIEENLSHIVKEISNDRWEQGRIMIRLEEVAKEMEVDLEELQREIYRSKSPSERRTFKSPTWSILSEEELKKSLD